MSLQVQYCSFQGEPIGATAIELIFGGPADGDSAQVLYGLKPSVRNVESYVMYLTYHTCYERCRRRSTYIFDGFPPVYISLARPVSRRDHSWQSFLNFWRIYWHLVYWQFCIYLRVLYCRSGSRVARAGASSRRHFCTVFYSRCAFNGANMRPVYGSVPSECAYAVSLLCIAQLALYIIII